LRHYVYNTASELVRYTDRNNRVTTYQYDNLGRETAENWLDSGENVTHSFSHAYDTDGQLLSAADSDSTDGSTDTFAYDALGQLTTETQTIAGLTPVTVQNVSGTVSRKITRPEDCNARSQRFKPFGEGDR
jgi:YD repeat-containing protein